MERRQWASTAAFLLYDRRDVFDQQRLLIVGPNRLFLRYIAKVLPSLAEYAVTQLTIEGLAGGRVRARATDNAAAAAVKGKAEYGRGAPKGDARSHSWVARRSR